jgi:hypothetical protein
MVFLRTKIAQKLRELDVSSTYAFIVGITSFIISFIVTGITLYKLLMQGTSFWIAIITSLIVFYIFSELYALLILIALRIFEKTEKNL